MWTGGNCYVLKLNTFCTPAILLRKYYVHFMFVSSLLSHYLLFCTFLTPVLLVYVCAFFVSTFMEYVWVFINIFVNVSIYIYVFMCANLSLYAKLNKRRTNCTIYFYFSKQTTWIFLVDCNFFFSFFFLYVTCKQTAYRCKVSVPRALSSCKRSFYPRNHPLVENKLIWLALVRVQVPCSMALGACLTFFLRYRPLFLRASWNFHLPNRKRLAVPSGSGTASQLCEWS